jgi:hypothetical protein
MDVSKAGIMQNELVCRAHVPLFVAAFNRPANAHQRAIILGILYNIDDHRITEVMRGCTSPDREEEPYYCTMYLAKQGDTNALAILNKNYYAYPISSWQWSYSVALFGRFGYRAATTNLLESLDAASLNVAGAAAEALQQLYPSGPRQMWPPDSVKVLWTQYLKQVRAAPPD